MTKLNNTIKSKHFVSTLQRMNNLTHEKAKKYIDIIINEMGNLIEKDGFVTLDLIGKFEKSEKLLINFIPSENLKKTLHDYKLTTKLQMIIKKKMPMFEFN